MSCRVSLLLALMLAACGGAAAPDVDGGIDLDRDGARERNDDGGTESGGPQRGRPSATDVGGDDAAADAPVDLPAPPPGPDGGGDLPLDPTCAVPCVYANATGVCQDGQCRLGTCRDGWADCNAWSPDGCETLLNSVDHCGSCARKCGEDAPVCVLGGGAPRCANPGASVDGQRLEFPCGEILPVARGCANRPAATTVCPAGGNLVTRIFTLGGAKGSVYEVMIHFRGALEGKTYTGGLDLGDFFYAGGVPSPTKPNTMTLSISSPRQTFYLNHEAMVPVPPRILVLNHVKTLRIEGGATVTLTALDDDCAILRNCREPDATTICTPHIVPGVPPAPAGFNGQFLHLDVVGTKSAAARPGEI